MLCEDLKNLNNFDLFDAWILVSTLLLFKSSIISTGWLFVSISIVKTFLLIYWATETANNYDIRLKTTRSNSTIHVTYRI